MFRPMRRWKQQLSDEDCIAILKSELRGILSVLGDDGYPYGIPMNHWYCEADGKLYFHGAKTGHKIDAISQCDKVSYCVHDEGYREDGQWPLQMRKRNWKSARTSARNLLMTRRIWNMNCSIPVRMCCALH